LWGPTFTAGRRLWQIQPADQLLLISSSWLLPQQSGCFLARRLQMRGAWFYVMVVVLIAISFTFPLFLINRERALSRLDTSLPGGHLTVVDILGLAGLAAVFVVYVGIALVH